MVKPLSLKHHLLLIKYLYSDRYTRRKNIEETVEDVYGRVDSGMFISDHSFWGEPKRDDLTRYAMFEMAESLLTLKIAKNGTTKQDGKGPIRL